MVWSSSQLDGQITQHSTNPLQYSKPAPDCWLISVSQAYSAQLKAPIIGGLYSVVQITKNQIMDLFADQDVKLQRTSSDLISTFETSVRRYLWKTASRAEAKEQKLRLRESVGVLHLRNLVDLVR